MLVFFLVPFRAKLVQRFDFFVSEKKELQQEQTKLKWERDNYLKQLKNSQVLLETAVDSVKVREAFLKYLTILTKLG